MVTMTSASAPRRSRSTDSNGRPRSAAVSARRESISGWKFQPITFSKFRWRAAARIWKADWCPAPTMPRTFASFRARCLIETAAEAAVRAAVR